MNHLKLIAVIDLSKLRLYEAQGFKITNELEELPLSLEREHKHQIGSYQKGSNPSSGYDPHTSDKEVIYTATSKIIADHLEKIINNGYKEVIITAEPKMLGYIRQNLTPQVKKLVTKEVIKDLAHHDKAAIESSIFS